MTDFACMCKRPIEILSPLFLWGLCIYGYQGSILFLFLFSENCANAPALHGEIFEGKKKEKKRKN